MSLDLRISKSPNPLSSRMDGFATNSLVVASWFSLIFQKIPPHLSTSPLAPRGGRGGRPLLLYGGGAAFFVDRDEDHLGLGDDEALGGVGPALGFDLDLDRDGGAA